MKKGYEKIRGELCTEIHDLMIKELQKYIDTHKLNVSETMSIVNNLFMNVNDTLRITPTEFTQTVDFMNKAYIKNFLLEPEDSITGDVFIVAKENLS